MVEEILRFHLNRYPEMQIQDVYKLLHQAALGNAHAVSNADAAKNWLTSELKEMGEGPAEPLIDPVSPNGEIVRVHLRPFITAEYDPDLLLDAFICTSKEVYGDAHLLKEYWQAAINTAYLPLAEMDKFFRSMEAENYPAVHHSPQYENLYRPAYRVVALVFCPEIWQ
jgi:hypothetical protein